MGVLASGLLFQIPRLKIPAQPIYVHWHNVSWRPFVDSQRPVTIQLARRDGIHLFLVKFFLAKILPFYRAHSAVIFINKFTKRVLNLCIAFFLFFFFYRCILIVLMM